MVNVWSSGKNSIAICDVCGFQYKLHELKEVIVKTVKSGILACSECWDEDHPQLQLGMYPVDDPQAVEHPRRDNSYFANGNKGAGGSRMIDWNFNPVGGSLSLVGISSVGKVTIQVL